jgi:hypothetical protein
MFFFPVPPLDAHGNRAERARPEAAHFAGGPRPTGEIFSFEFAFGDLTFEFLLGGMN